MRIEKIGSFILDRSHTLIMFMPWDGTSKGVVLGTHPFLWMEWVHTPPSSGLG